jgi:hypothetical protein
MVPVYGGSRQSGMQLSDEDSGVVSYVVHFHLLGSCPQPGQLKSLGLTGGQRLSRLR